MKNIGVSFYFVNLDRVFSSNFSFKNTNSTYFFPSLYLAPKFTHQRKKNNVKKHVSQLCKFIAALHQ